MMLRPKEVVCKWVDAFNGHDVDAIVSLYHDNATNHQVTNEPVIGIDAIREMFTALKMDNGQFWSGKTRWDCGDAASSML